MDNVLKEDLADYVKKLDPKEGDLIVFDERYVTIEMGKQVMDVLTQKNIKAFGIILPNLDGIGIITLPRKHG